MPSSASFSARIEAFPTAPELMGGSPAAERARRTMALAMRSADPVLISAEEGLDGMAVARAIHDGSACSAGAFLAIDCAGQNLAALERRLLGRPGAGTANVSGTLALADLDALPVQLQERLAQAVGDGRIGARFVAIIRGDVEADIRGGRLHPDLCARFEVRLVLPPLRHRPADISTLIGCIIAEAAAASRTPVPSFSREALTLLSALPWRGNLVELREVLDVLVPAAAGGTVRLDDVLGHVPIERVSSRRIGAGSLREARLGFEREYIAGVLHRHRWRMDEAAKSLGIQRTNLYRKVRQLGLGRAR